MVVAVAETAASTAEVAKLVSSKHCGVSMVRAGKAVNGKGGLDAGHDTMNSEAMVKTEFASRAWTEDA